MLRDADVVVTDAGQNAIAEIAACRTPAVVVPADRPHEEQATTASVLAGTDWPALVLPTFPERGLASAAGAGRGAGRQALGGLVRRRVPPRGSPRCWTDPATGRRSA